MGELFSINSKIIEELKEKELSLEYQLISIRHVMKEVYDAALEYNKKVIVTSDTYFTEDFIKKILWKNGYVGISRYYVSSQLGKRKDTGEIYDYILQDLNISPSRILHIGDNPNSDCKIPHSKGLNVAYYSKCFDRLQKSKLSTYMSRIDLESTNSITAGLYINFRDC